MLVIAHRGASAFRPEHTLEAYRLAVEQGADVIEPDVVATRDGALVVRHENEISQTTDVARRPELADRRRTKTVDGVEKTGWFTEDLTLAEIQSLRAVERLPSLRPGSAAFDGQFSVPTLDQVLRLADDLGAARGRPVGVYPETKHPSHFRRIGLPLEIPACRDAPPVGQGRGRRVGPVVRGRRSGASARADRAALGATGGGRGGTGGPARSDHVPRDDHARRAGDRRYAYADVLGPPLALVLNDDLTPTPLVADAHRAGLAVHVWTVRPENAFLPRALQSSDEPGERGDVGELVRALEAAGVSGVFTDDPAATLAALGR